MKPWIVAIWLGFLAGAITSVVLVVMGQFEDLIWAGDRTWLRIFLTVMAGAVLIALLRPHAPDASVETEIEDETADVARQSLRAAGYFTVLGVVSVAFGAALGPEGGILALIGQLSAYIARRIGKTAAEERLIRQMGTAGALGGLYHSPPGGASYTDSRPDAPWPLLLIAGLSGFAGLMLTSALLPKGHGLRIPLPASQAAVDAQSLTLLLLAAVFGAALGLVFLGSRSVATRALAWLSGDVRVQVLAGSLVFAILAAIWPILLFNGQEALSEVVTGALVAGPGLLVAIALLKAIAAALCLAAGWLGGPVMPIAFVGATGGLALAQLVPGLDPGLAAAAGVGAAETVALRRPLVALLVVVFTATTAAPIAVLIGVAVGWAVSARLPAAAPAHH
ncbi:MAG: chloride channel protein [Rhodobacteraceae bacterium]|jgi:H+/Cl- antiporter ClcA|nr:chloride channel protein [Paracoccaceae bacterium]